VEREGAVTAPRRWYALVTFEAETPEDDLAADDMADALSDALLVAVAALPGVDEATVQVPDLDTLHDAFDVDVRTLRRRP
jgi:hypothetical protein